jgi:hypothetical protein
MMQQSTTVHQEPADLRVGEMVEVRSREEILASLDEHGELDALPFMPEMLQFAGRRLRVDKLAIKVCDTIDWSGMYAMDDAVHLAGARCDGSAHGGCQAGCLLYWKQSWLKRVGAEDAEAGPSNAGITEDDLLAVARRTDDSGVEVFSCQATEMKRAAPKFLPFWDVRQYVRDVRSGNAGAWATAHSVAVGAFNKYQDLSKRLLPRALWIRDAVRYPFIQGNLRRTPTGTLDLQPGEIVRVKSAEEIVRTLDADNKNRGMSFDREMLKYCGRQARVLRRVERIIDEKTGRMMHLKNPCIVLDDVFCTSDYHRKCPRAIYSYWREIWLERV